MTRPALFRSSISKLVLLASICSLGLVALPTTASATVASPVCSIDDPTVHQVQHGQTSAPLHYTCDNNGDGAISVIVSVQSDGRGTATVDTGAQTITYAADNDTDGPDTVTFEASTTNSTASTFDVDYIVNNSSPECDPSVDVTVRAGANAQLPIDLTSACSDPDLGDALNYTAPADQTSNHGTLATADPTLGQATYALASAHFSSASPFVDSFAVTVSDGDTSDDQVLTVNVTVTPDAPPICTIASGDDHKTVAHEQQTITIPISCSDADSDAFTVSLPNRTGSEPGVAQLDSTSNPTHITYESNESGVGADTIDVHVVSTRNPSLTFDLPVHVTVTDSAPVCTAVALSVRNDGATGGDLACTDADGDALVYTVGQAPAHGTAKVVGSSFSYVPSATFAGTETMTILADDGAIKTPITVTITVTAAPVVTPPVVTPPAVTPPAVTPPAVTPPAVVATPPAPKISGTITFASGALTLPLGCASQKTTCKASISLAATIAGKVISLGSKAVTIKPGKKGALRIALSKAARTKLRGSAGKTITIRVAVRTKNPKSGKTSTTTRPVKVHLPK